MKIALYARVSKALEQNPENQLIELRRWASLLGHDVVGEFVDEISSKDTRPMKEEVLVMLRRGEIQGVAFWSLDRWGRSMGELVLEIEEFSKKNMLMFSFKESLDLTTAAGRAFAYNMAAFANFERDRIRERTLLGLARAKAQGKRLGRPRKTPPANPSPICEGSKVVDKSVVYLGSKKGGSLLGLISEDSKAKKSKEDGGKKEFRYPPSFMKVLDGIVEMRDKNELESKEGITNETSKIYGGIDYEF